MHHYMIYWPLSKESFKTKRCLYEESLSTLSVKPKPFHFVYITAMLAKIHPEKSRFRACHCKDHASHIKLDWREFVYPQFVELLFKRTMTPTRCSSPMASHTLQLVNESLQCRFEIDREASFLALAVAELFTLPCSELSQRHGNSHLAVFGHENVAEEHHFRARDVTPYEYKLQFTITESKIRVGTKTGGGARLVLKKTAVPYVIIAANFHFLPPVADGATHYNFYVQSECSTASSHHLVWQTKRRIKSNKFCAQNLPCMIVSTSPLTLEFKEGVQGWFILHSPGECGVSLTGEECRLEMWNKEPGRCGWPLRYEIADFFLKRDYAGHEAKFFEKIHSLYHNLFHHPSSQRYEMLSPAAGYVYMCEDRVVVLNANNEVCERIMYRDQQMDMNQYASQSPYATSETTYRSAIARELQENVRAYFNRGKLHFGPGYHITTVSYTLVKVDYKLQALCRKDETSPIAYFYVNREKTFILFIPVY